MAEFIINSTLSWSPMQGDDLPAVDVIARQLHPEYPEAPAVFTERLALFPEGCTVCRDGEGRAVGYAVAHPATVGRPPCLDSLLGALPDPPESLHLHDIALLPAIRGRGLVEDFLTGLWALARELSLHRLTLIAIAGREAAWHRRGFRPCGGDGELARRLGSYGKGAVYMAAQRS